MAQRLATIFGGSGFIGRYLVRHLAAAGWRVRVAVRDTQKAQFLKTAGDLGQVSFIPASVTDPASVAAAVAGSDVVINLVGVLFDMSKRSFKAIHVDGAATVARAAAAAGAARLIHMSALGADEHSPSAYARSKAQGEAAVRAAFPTATIFRPSIVFGPEDGFFNLYGLIAQVLPFIPYFTNTNPRAPEGGGASFQPVYVLDVVQAMMKAITDNGHAGRTYELCGPRIYSMRDIVELVNRATMRNRMIVGLPYIAAWGPIAVGAVVRAVLRYATPLLPTADQVKLLKMGNVATGRLPGLEAFGIAPTMPDVIVPTYLKRFRPLQQNKRLRTPARHGA
ncbi:MAG: complex I NDUFA9 subunit family protein [Rhodospirillaceae bacterium]|nr:complex I NDUFA9 subunit family protein [Rhodospirillaceae bacterium]